MGQPWLHLDKRVVVAIPRWERPLDIPEVTDVPGKQRLLSPPPGDESHLGHSRRLPMQGRDPPAVALEKEDQATLQGRLRVRRVVLDEHAVAAVVPNLVPVPSTKLDAGEPYSCNAIRIILDVATTQLITNQTT